MTARAAANPLQPIVSVVRDARFLQIIGQVVFLILVILAVTSVANQITGALSSRNLTPNLAFLGNRAGFEIAGAGDYSPDDSYWDAFNVGLRNTLAVVVAGLIGATVLGVVVGILLLSDNWLLRNITRAIVELLRNTPLLIQIFVAYFVVVLSLPIQRESLQFPPEGVLSLPLRLLLYAVALAVGWRIARMEPAAAWRVALLPFLLSLIARIEFGITRGYAGAASIEALTLGDAGGYALLLVLAIVLGALIVRDGARIVPVTLGLILGQIIGAALVFLNVLPDAALRLELTPAFFLSNRGLVYPLLQPTARFGEWVLFLVVGVVVAVAQWSHFGRLKAETGEARPRLLYAIAAIVGFGLMGWLILAREPAPSTIAVVQEGATVVLPLNEARAAGLLTPEDELQVASTPLLASVPRPQGLRFAGGETLSQTYIALLLALVIYTAAFIAEIVRAGILAVPPGQLEAARSLGLKYGQLLRLVILPQALRVIIPPLGNQYLNLAKNSSLGVAIAFADVYGVMYTVINQSGQAVTGILIVMTTYLIISLVIASGVNWLNRRFQIVTR